MTAPASAATAGAGRRAAPDLEWFVAAVGAIGTAFLTWSIVASAEPRPGAWAAFAALAVTTLVGELFPIQLPHGADVESFTVTDVAWTAALLLSTPPAVLLGSVGVGVLVAHALRRSPPIKIVFNTSQYLVSLGAAVLLVRSLHPGTALAPRAWLVTVVGMAAYLLLNETLVATVISLSQGERMLPILLGPLVLNVLHWAGNVAIGIAAGAMWSLSPVGAAFLSVPLGLSYLAYGAWLSGMRDRDRMRDLYDAGQALLSDLEIEGDFGPFLALVTRMVDGIDAELVVRDGRSTTVYSAEGVRRRLEGSPGDTPLEGLLSRPEGMTVEAAGFGDPSGTSGILGVSRTRPMRPTERSLLNALAAQIEVKLRHTRLFSLSERRRMELDDLVGSTSDGIAVLDGTGCVTAWNGAMERITGYPAPEAVGQPLAVLLRLEREPEEGEEAEEGGSLTTTSFQLKDGRAGWLRLTSNRIRGDHLGHARVVVARDVTAELEAEQAKSNFVAAVSHELRTPLVPIKGYLTMLCGGVLDPGAPESAEYFASMLKQANRLEHLVSDLLEVTSMESGARGVELVELDLVALVDDHVKDHRLLHPGRTIRLQVPDGPMWAVGDTVRVGEVLTNLLSNSLKYSAPELPIDVDVQLVAGRPTVSIRDRGDGIPAADQERIFERFHRLDNSTTRRTDGVGLGLYIARELVRAMSGRLWLDSVPGDGTTFHFTLPAAERTSRSSGTELAARG